MRFGQRTAHSLAVLLAGGGGTRLHSFLELRVRVWHHVHPRFIWGIDAGIGQALAFISF
jgi:hypothetical protein